MKHFVASVKNCISLVAGPWQGLATKEMQFMTE
jgi:hypothetical protein